LPEPALSPNVTAATPPRGPILITGAGQRIGRAIALDLAARGHPIGIHVNASVGPGEEVAAAIRATGGVATVIRADLGQMVEVDKIVPEMVRRLGAPHAVINNASMFVYDEVATLEHGLYGRHLAVNLEAPVFLAKALAEHLPSGASGNVINIIDQRVWKPTPHFVSYSIAKAGLWAATRQLAQALAPRIRVNAIGPGPVLQSIHQSAEDFAQQAKATLLGRGTSPDEIAATIRFILDAPAMTGQMIALDGGQHLAWQTPDVGDGRG
jgi:NAD(P)-dependent dehydrogenase (short-subunit alcohol dehydrogenase family)